MPVMSAMFVKISDLVIGFFATVFEDRVLDLVVLAFLVTIFLLLDSDRIQWTP